MPQNSKLLIHIQPWGAAKMEYPGKGFSIKKYVCSGWNLNLWPWNWPNFKATSQLVRCPPNPTRLLHQVFHLTFSGFHGGSIPPPHTGKSKIHPQPFGGQIMQHHLKCRYIIDIYIYLYLSIYIYICICITTVNPISKYSKSINPHEIQIFRL